MYRSVVVAGAKSCALLVLLLVGGCDSGDSVISDEAGASVSTGGSLPQSGGTSSGGTPAGGQPAGGAAAGTAAGGTPIGGSPSAGGTPSGGSSSTGGTPSSCGQMSGSGNLTEQWDYVRVIREGLEYIVQNNVWGNQSARQILQVRGTSFKVIEQTGDNSSSGSPVSYPSIFIGSNNDRATANSGLPRQVSSLGRVMTSFSHNATGSIAGIYNAAYDVWFSTSSAGDPKSPSGGYLMVWLYDPPNKQPVGSRRWSAVSIPGVDGSWDVWLGGNPPVISYLRTQATTSLTFDLNSFIQDAVTNRSGSIQAQWYLTNIFAGFEIWQGGVGLEVSCFYVEMS